MTPFVCKDFLYDTPFGGFPMARLSEKIIPRVERVNLLMDIYGDLLTEKQRRFVVLHFGEDLSFGEIAAQFHVSRQAIYDAVKHAIANLEKFEGTLGIVAKLKQGGDDTKAESPPIPVSATPAIDLQSLLNNLTHIRTRVKKQRIIYNVDWIVGEISKAISILEKGLSAVKAE